MNVIVVEARSVVHTLGGKYVFDTDLAHVASSWEKAIIWMREHADFCAKPTRWWWVAYEQAVDGQDIPEGHVRFFDLETKEMRLQPMVPPLFPVEG